MCSRYENGIPEEELTETLSTKNIKIEAGREKLKGKEFFPGSTIRIIKPYESENLALVYANWGIKFKSDSPLIFNSRIETIRDKSYWKGLLGKNRVALPMTAFFEYKGAKGSKVPYRIFLKKDKLFFVPAIFVLKDNETFVSLITTEPNDFVSEYHNRMPVIFDFDNAIQYINSDNVNENIDRCLNIDIGDMGAEKINKA